MLESKLVRGWIESSKWKTHIFVQRFEPLIESCYSNPTQQWFKSCFHNWFQKTNCLLMIRIKLTHDLNYVFKNEILFSQSCSWFESRIPMIKIMFPNQLLQNKKTSYFELSLCMIWIMPIKISWFKSHTCWFVSTCFGFYSKACLYAGKITLFRRCATLLIVSDSITKLMNITTSNKTFQRDRDTLWPILGSSWDITLQRKE